MEKDRHTQETSCRRDAGRSSSFRAHLPEIVDQIVRSCENRQCCHHTAYEPIPSRESVIEIVEGLRDVIFPGYFNRNRMDPVNLKYMLGQSVSGLYDMLAEQICRSIRHDCFRYEKPCMKCEEQGQEIALALFRSVPDIQAMLSADVAAAYEGDPAAASEDEIIFSYPGIFAIMVYRVAHRLFEFEVPLLPRIMTEYAHSITGIDIHPGAEIGTRFVIDHGTGVVIGETTVIGHNVRVYQGVTLGALSLPKDAGERLRGKKRHPTIEDDVIIYSGATILGGDTVIGRRCVIGGNVWLTASIPPDTRVLMEPPKLVYR
ncbi:MULTISPECIES: serine O-acetyltransferase EpsC [Desulfococcus]|jgi:serine O-acetyltransferase|uniref:Transferase hexapeptide repeat containing protein n=1 Tax=Desulfococcus multivorans DSM 2059 TaxID=1121405 RepID=S7U1V1_DESML|nr:serine O-acetyltransferase EpsC [Desulfococcus multivorans]AOY59311.1 CysE: serine acetyltransferase [Desulfococcus multivorans]AQV01530.1 serine acetyltransferase [Desulfococcus multivorans]EPR42995.1 transferase hexapeptide repeat containing protein [Desulfococcus multivorans DSM 2059]SKA14593.1 serine O-acetyltransferase [Desulfococcus multivorans DSM 2059]